jgi:uncharacterized protein YdhG (YjbR/CyaY superfamily)
MAAKKPATKSTQKFTAEERAAMRERARELKAAQSKEEAERDVLEKIAEMNDSDRAIAERIHAIVKASAPSLSPRTWYGMPAYANEAGKIVCFFQNSAKFKTRYSTFGFNESANLDQGSMWPVAYALTELTSTEETKIAALVKKAVR